jgi:hypothetical protein
MQKLEEVYIYGGIHIYMIYSCFTSDLLIIYIIYHIYIYIYGARVCRVAQRKHFISRLSEGSISTLN